MVTARKHFGNKRTAGDFQLLKKTQGHNTGAIRMPFPQKNGKLATEWIVFWSPGIINPARSRRA